MGRGVASSGSGDVDDSGPSEEDEGERCDAAEHNEPFGNAVQHDSLQEWQMPPP